MDILNSLISSVLPEPLGKAVKFYNKNKSTLDGYASEGKRLLKVINAECSDQGALRHTIEGFRQPTQNLALDMLGMRNANTVAENGDFVKKAEKAVGAHAKKESTKKDLRALMAKIDTTLNAFRTAVPQNSTPSSVLSGIAASMVKKQIDMAFKEINTEVFGNKSKS
ncbi:MAG: hypothetical protein LBJ75_04375 [Puniceicoccales bacterium]|jgi:hypothetical protein|nr:hypothetical protein [Puniceicoccales bacterium]